ncbi:MAG: rhombosortase [Aquirhabdus sp.]
MFFTECVYRHQDLFSEPWRLWTGHWVHLGVWHWILNIAALALLPEIFWRASWKLFLILWFTLPLLLSLALWSFLPSLSLYAGLSGVLHGIYLAIALSAISYATGVERQIGWIVLIGVIAKVSYEAFRGMSQTADLIGAPVILQAHQFGAVLGLLVWVVVQGVYFLTQKKSTS